MQRIIIPATIGLALFFIGLSILPSAPNFEERLPLRDEIGWMAISHDTYVKFSDDGLAEVDWRDGLQKTTYGAMNPNLAKLLFGWQLDQMAYDLPPPKVFPVIHPMAKGRMKNPKFVLNQVGPHEDFMVALRNLDLRIMALAGVGLFLVGLLVGGYTMGFATWILFITTADIHEVAPIVMTDNLLLVFLCAGIFITMLALRKLRCSAVPLWKSLLWMTAVGLVLGMAPSTKLNGALSCIGFAIALLGLWLCKGFQLQKKWHPIAWAGVSSAVACGLFVALYPLLWGDIRGELNFVFERWDKLIESQTTQLAHIALPDLASRMAAIWQRGVLDVGPAWLAGWMVASLAVLGFALLSLQAIGNLRNQEQAPHAWVLLCFMLVWCLETAVWIPLDWTRYYLPVMVFTCFLAALPFASLTRFLMSRFPKRQTATRTVTSVAATLALLIFTPSCNKQEAEIAQPHILLLSVDTLRPDYLGMYGYPYDSSPYLDSLLADAFHFPKTVATVPRTTPSLASILTGAYPHTTGVRVLRHALKDDVIPITETLKADGYQTLAVVTNQMLGPERKLSRGFDTYLSAKDTRDAKATTDVLLDELKDLDFTQPLFLWAHYIDPHMPYVADPSIIRSFAPEYVGRYAKQFGQFPAQEPPKNGEKWRKGPYPPDLPKSIAVHNNPLPEEVVSHVRDLYAADVRSTDNQIKRLVEDLLLKTDGNLLVVFTSDHGESLGEHDFFWDHGDYVYNAASRIPFAILLPQDHPNHGYGSYPAWVSATDIVPTVLDLLGKNIPDNMRSQMDGRSLAPQIRGQALGEIPVFVESGHSHFFGQIKGRASNDIAGKFRAVYSEDWKLIWAPGHKDPRVSWQLFDLAADPHEENNLFRMDHPQFLRLRALLLPWAEKSLGLTDSSEASAADLDLMNELGYIDSGSEE
ncbi:MAG: hypothetical protein COA70_14010 [Planctomycetota bacterium]|nr:MAG: hypothetical protein COA70_14010 [Planctomycetota bacterium]